MDQFKSRKIKEALKSLLKKKEFTYENLAAHLECSVPTVKRILGPEDLSLNRLLQICDFLEIELAELDALAGASESGDESFSKEQDAFLARHPSHFAYLMRLFAGDSPRKIADTYGLTARSTDKYLLALEKQNLIRVTGKLKVKPAFKRVPLLGRGPLAKVFFEKMIRAAAQFFINNIHESFAQVPDPSGPGKKFGILSLKVSRATFEAWTREQEASFRNLEKMGAFEEKSKPESELMTAVVLNAHAHVQNDSRDLALIEETMGSIVNL
ncbi:MAG: helix-turn-helix transcriptional regulator [Bdellovibrionaceae bacterium]|nr:helix-turn-helix transcriptional regulator [Pseudobdellovibrionaceae bacterium]